MGRTTPTPAAAVLPVAALLVTAGCSSPATSSAKAAGSTPGTGGGSSAPARTARVFVTVTTDPGSTQTLTEQGLQDFVTGRAQFTVASGNDGGEARRIGDVLYVRRSPAPAGTSRPWSRKTVTSGVLPGAATGGSTLDPADQFRVLSSVSDQVVKVGPETVRGTPTTHYRLTVDVARAAAKQGPAAVCAARGEPRPTFPVDVDVDAQGRVRRVTERVSVGESGPSPSGAGVQTVTDYTDFGTAVSIQAPPADQVAPGPATPLAPTPSCP